MVLEGGGESEDLEALGGGQGGTGNSGSSDKRASLHQNL